MTITTNSAHLRKLCIRARQRDLAIGQWWFGPAAGKYYIVNLRSSRIEAGEFGMSLAGLSTWFARFDWILPERRTATETRHAA